MPSYTKNLELLKKDPVEDGSDTFNIETMLNENWDKIDKAVGQKADVDEDGKIPEEQVPDGAVKNALETAETKDSPADGDGVVIVDSADENKPKRVLWSAFKTALNLLYAAKSHTHKKADISDFPSSMTPAAHASTHRTGGGDALTPKDIGACTAPVAVSVTLTVSGWSSASGCWTQTVACTGLLTTDNQSTVMVLPGGSSDADARILIDEAYAAVAGPGGKFECSTNGKLTATGPKGGDKPAVDLPLTVCIAR